MSKEPFEISFISIKNNILYLLVSISSLKSECNKDLHLTTKSMNLFSSEILLGEGQDLPSLALVTTLLIFYTDSEKHFRERKIERENIQCMPVNVKSI